MNLLLKKMRENQEVILEMKNISPDGKLPRGALMSGRTSIKFDHNSFVLTKELDTVNEKRPKKKK
jgi:hypothetical protein